MEIPTPPDLEAEVFHKTALMMIAAALGKAGWAGTRSKGSLEKSAGAGPGRGKGAGK